VATANTTPLGPVSSFFLYGEAPRADDERTLHVETIEFRSARHHWKISPHMHRTLHQLVLVLRGRGTSLAEGVVVRFSPPALVVVPAGTVHGFEFEADTRGFVVSITQDLAREVAQREPGIAGLFENPATFEFHSDALCVTDLADGFEMLTRELDRALPGHALALEGLLKVILANALRLAHTPTDSAEAAAGRYRLLVTRFRKLVEGAFRDGWSLADYTAALNVSQSQLRNACLGVTEESPMQIVHARILLEAKRQLLYTSMAVREVGYALGFDDPAYFTRFFSQRTGVSPRAFRLRGPLG
jgi:AraC family transcriptional regulator, transcriptional activator of pobA